jgi:hypothetical protein
MKGWKKCPSVTPGGKPFFYHNAAKKLRVVWDRRTESWGIFDAEYNRLMPGRSYHYKTPTSAMNAAERMT